MSERKWIGLSDTDFRNGAVSFKRLALSMIEAAEKQCPNAPAGTVSNDTSLMMFAAAIELVEQFQGREGLKALLLGTIAGLEDRRPPGPVQ